VVKNRNTGKGTPVAFMLTTGESQCVEAGLAKHILTLSSVPIADWLAWLRDELGFSAHIFMIDCLDTEALAIRTTFGAAVAIYFCMWHFFRAVRGHLKEVR
jgi:hypothetical protein